MSKQIYFYLSENDRMEFLNFIMNNNNILISYDPNSQYRIINDIRKVASEKNARQMYVFDKINTNDSFIASRDIINNSVEFTPCTYMFKDINNFIPESRLYLFGDTKLNILFQSSCKLFNTLKNYIRNKCLISTINHYTGREALKLYIVDGYILGFKGDRRVFFTADKLIKYYENNKNYFGEGINLQPFITK